MGRENQLCTLGATLKYSGRIFNETEIDFLRNLALEPGISRRKISERFCEKFDWRKQNGTLKDMRCRVAILRMHEDGLIQLQPVKCRKSSDAVISHTQITAPQPEILCSLKELRELRFELVLTKDQSRIWNEYIDRYHYLGHKKILGAQLRYFVHSEKGLLALFGFGGAAWKVDPRDKFIGWSSSQREKNLQLIVNNVRFLILPWVHSRHLASKLLGLVSRRISKDWMDHYGYCPALLETFVEKQRFSGTCYRAANWINLGDTKGRGKLDRTKACALPIKSIWVLPLTKKFREILK